MSNESYDVDLCWVRLILRRVYWISGYIQRSSWEPCAALLRSRRRRYSSRCHRKIIKSEIRRTMQHGFVHGMVLFKKPASVRRWRDAIRSESEPRIRGAASSPSVEVTHVVPNQSCYSMQFVASVNANDWPVLLLATTLGMQTEVMASSETREAAYGSAYLTTIYPASVRSSIVVVSPFLTVLHPL